MRIFKINLINVEIIINFEQYLIFTGEIMKIFTILFAFLFFLGNNSYSQTSNKQKAALKKLESFGCVNLYKTPKENLHINANLMLQNR